MSEQVFRLYQGHVARVEVTHDGKWTLVFVVEKEADGREKKPLAILNKGYSGTVPQVGDTISVQASDGHSWAFCEHRAISIQNPEPYYPLEVLPNQKESRTQIGMRIILEKLKTQRQVKGDDVELECQQAIGAEFNPVTHKWNPDPRWIGHSFRTLKHRGMIHENGWLKSRNAKTNHCRKQCVWELGPAKKN